MPPISNKPVEKAKNFSKTIKQLLAYSKPYYLHIVAMLVLMVTSTIMCIYGPRLIGNATTLLAEGVLSKYHPAGT